MAEARLIVGTNARTNEKRDSKVLRQATRDSLDLERHDCARFSIKRYRIDMPADRSRQAVCDRSRSLAFVVAKHTRESVCIHTALFAVRLGGSDPESHRPMRGESGRPKAVQMGVAPAQTLNPVVRPRSASGSRFCAVVIAFPARRT